MKKRAAQIIKILRRRYPEAGLALQVSSPFETYIATLLSAQCTDVRVNIVTKALFKKYRVPADYLRVSQKELERDINSVGLFRSKAKSIQAGCRTLVDEFGGRVPDTMEGLLRLGGVGRKTANVILGNAFGKPGIAVDTHVGRVSRRIGFTENKDPVKVEFDLMELVPKKGWTMFSHLLIFHGRNICHARKPLCDECPIKRLCDTGSKVISAR